MNKTLRDRYTELVEEYVETFLTNYGLDHYISDEWVANEIGGTYITADDKYVDFDDIRYCVDNNVTYEEFDEWYYYTERATMCSISVPNLKSWHHGCPRLTEEELHNVELEYNHIEELKRELEEEIININKDLEAKNKNPY